MKRRTPPLVTVAIILASVLGSTARPARSQDLIPIPHYDESGVRFRTDSPLPARDVVLPPIIFNGQNLPPGSTIDCGFFAGNDGSGVRGVLVDTEPVFIQFDDQGNLVRTDLEVNSFRTNGRGWNEFDIVPPPDFFGSDDDVVVVNFNPRGPRVVDTILHQCLLGAGSDCIGDGTTACLNVGGPGRFRVDADWIDFVNGQPREARVERIGKVPETLSDPAGAFVNLSFPPTNLELVVKVLDGCDVAGSRNFWVFAAGTTDVELTLTVTDTETGATKQYFNPLGQAFADVGDTTAFGGCP